MIWTMSPKWSLCRIFARSFPASCGWPYTSLRDSACLGSQTGWVDQHSANNISCTQNIQCHLILSNSVAVRSALYSASSWWFYRRSERCVRSFSARRATNSSHELQFWTKSCKSGTVRGRVKSITGRRAGIRADPNEVCLSFTCLEHENRAALILCLMVWFHLLWFHGPCLWW